jgi:arylsulfatase A-like enzyme
MKEMHRLTMKQRPNILCISIDSLRSDFCSFVADCETTTPFLDSFTADAAVFSNAISPSIWTLPVHTSVFSGLYPPEHQVTEPGVALGSHPTFAELLAEEGYQTDSFGYNGWLHQGDILRGFDEHNLDQPEPNDGNTVNDIGNLIERYLGSWAKDQAGTAYNRVQELRKRVHQARFPDDWLDESTVELTLDHFDSVSEPFCTFVHLNDVHRPYTPPAPFQKQFGDHSSLSLFWHRVFWHEKIDDSNNEIIAGELDVPQKSIEVMRDLYRGCIYRADQLVQSMIESLRSHGMLENTVVILFGDHGDYLGEDGLFGHNNSLAVGEELFRVPLFIYDPTDSIETGHRNEVVQLNDIYPTILDLCGISPPENSSRSLINDEPCETAYVYFDARDSSYAEKRDNVPASRLPPQTQYAAWRGPGEYVVWDPDGETFWGPEQDNEGLRDDLRTHFEDLRPLEPANKDMEVEDHVMNRIEDMGYI